MISMIRPSTGPWGTPIVPGLQLGFVLHLMTARAQQFSYFSITVYSSTLYFISLSKREVIGGNVESLSKFKINNIQCSVLTCQASHQIVSDCQTPLPLHKSMLTTPKHPQSAIIAPLMSVRTHTSACNCSHRTSASPLWDVSVKVPVNFFR